MDLIEKTLVYKGETSTIYFRELNGAEQLDLMKGRKYTTTGREGSMSIDLGDELERDYRLVQMTACDADGKRLYANMQALLKEPGKKLKLLKVLAGEANKETFDDDETKPGKE